MLKNALAFVLLTSALQLQAIDLNSAANMAAQTLSGTQTSKDASLIQTLTKQLGVTPKQAEGGVGSILNFAKANLTSNDFSAITKAIPDASSLMSMASSLGDAKSKDALISNFSKLGLGSDMLSKFVPVIVGYLTNKSEFSAAKALTTLLQ